MAANLANKTFGHVLLPIDPDYLAVLTIFSNIRRNEEKNQLTTKQRRKKRSLTMLTQRPDMAALICMRECREVLMEEYQVSYDGFHNTFKRDYDNDRCCAALGFMEILASIFSRRSMEIEMVLKSHEDKTKKVLHAIRDCGTFDGRAYERGRDHAIRTIVLAIPRQTAFNLLEGIELLEESRAA